ncbi:hypothetical protein OQJ46_09980, partial [Microbulbifer thermotolerans]
LGGERRNSTSWPSLYQLHLLSETALFCSEVPRLMGLRTGAQRSHINKGVIDDSPIVMPCEKVLTDYYKVADPIFEKIMNLAFQSHEVINLRDWLLPMLMNGQVTVK